MAGGTNATIETNDLRGGTNATIETNDLRGGLEHGNDPVNKARELMKRFDQRLTLSNLRLDDRYNEGELQILVRFRTWQSDVEYVALFQRLEFPVVENPKVPVQHVVHNLAEMVTLQSLIPKLGLKCPSRCVTVMDYASGRTGSHNQSVLVDVVELVEQPKFLSLPTFVWFDVVDRFDRVLPRALYFSTSTGLVFRGIRGDREVSSLPRVGGDPSSDLDEIVRQVIEGTSEVLDGISSDGCDLSRNGIDSRGIIEALSRWRIRLYPMSIRLGLKEGFDSPLQIIDVLFGPFEF
jgi:hypothetical protein